METTPRCESKAWNLRLVLISICLLLVGICFTQRKSIMVWYYVRNGTSTLAAKDDALARNAPADAAVAFRDLSAAHDALAGMGPSIAPILRKYLRSEDPVCRRFVLTALFALKQPEDLDAFLKLMTKDPSPLVRNEAAIWVSLLGDPRAIPALAKNMGTDVLVGYHCIVGLLDLAAIGNKEAEASLFGAMLDEKRPELALRFCIALGCHWNKAVAKTFLRRLLDHPDPGVRERAQKALAEMEPPASGAP